MLATGKGRVPVEKRLSWQARGGRVRRLRPGWIIQTILLKGNDTVREKVPRLFPHLGTQVYECAQFQGSLVAFCVRMGGGGDGASGPIGEEEA